MFELRKVFVILVITVLYAAFVFSLIHAVYPEPEYNDYCKDSYGRPKPIMQETDCPYDPDIEAQREACIEQDMIARERYNATGCVERIECDDCQLRYDAERERYSLIYFIITAILGALSIIVGLLLPGKGSINEWIGSGLLLGGVVVIFGGTIVTFGDLSSWLRPIIMLAELILVIFLAYRLWGKEK